MRRTFTIILLVLATCSGSRVTADRSWKASSDRCQILDKLVPDYTASLSFTPSSRFEGYGHSTMLELTADWNFAYFRDILNADWDISLNLWDTIFPSTAKLDLPDHASIMRMSLSPSWRFHDGISLLVHFLPGCYTDLKDLGPGALYCPVSAGLVRAFTPSVSGIAGLELRPGFENIAMPIIGIQWEISDEVRLEAGLPESHLYWYINRDYQTSLNFLWRNNSFALDDNRDMMTIEDFRWTWQLSYHVSDTLLIQGEIGKIYDRSIEFDKGSPRNAVDIDNATFYRAGISCPF